MTRRGAIGTITAVLTGALARLLSTPPETQRYGYMTREIAIRQGIDPAAVLVRFNGREVTQTAYACDDIRGFIDVYAEDAQGRKYSADGLSLAKERRYGRVEFIPNGQEVRS